MDSSRTPSTDEDLTEEELRARVEENYDLEAFSARDMARMSAEEWDAAFDADAWVTGPELLDRVEADLKARIARREVFAVLTRERREDERAGAKRHESREGERSESSDRANGEAVSREGERSEPSTRGSVDTASRNGEQRLLAYSDEGYAAVYEDGSVEGRGTVVRDVKPVVALASMPEYEVPDPPADGALPDPESVPEGSGDLGNKLMQAVAAIHVVAGLVLLVAWIPFGLNAIAAVAGFGFILFGAFLFVMVANARLSDRFRAEEYRDRLRAVESGGAPGDGDGGER